MRMSSDISAEPLIDTVELIGLPVATPSNLGFNTYGDAFRMALAHAELDKVEDADSNGDALEEPRKGGVVSALGSGVVSVLNNIFAGSSANPDEVQKNLEAFAAIHKGSIGLAIEERASKRLVDLERLEKCFERELGERNIDLDIH
jgi:hypothetical protein